MCVRDAQNLG
jgi:hypothetical protein